MKEVGEEILATVRDRVEALRDVAQGMVDDHWEFFKTENGKRKDFDDKSRLYPRLGKNKNAFSIEWHLVRRWYKGDDGKQKKVTQYVRRGRSFRTNLNAHARPWEMDALNAFEDRAEIIRREVKIHADYIESLDRFSRLQEKREEDA